MTYFFDTYAIIEIIKGSNSYERYQEARFVLTQLNLIEIHYFLLKELPDQAEIQLEKYSGHAVPIDNETIMNANRFRHSNRKKELSTADAIGYACAKKLGVIFITGDRQFEGMDNTLIVR